MGLDGEKRILVERMEVETGGQMTEKAEKRSMSNGRGWFVCTTRYFSARPQALFEGGPPRSVPLGFPSASLLIWRAGFRFLMTHVYTHTQV